MSGVRVGNQRVAAGEKAVGSLGTVSLGASSASIPFIAVNGVGEGPTLVVMAGSHGNEIVGSGAAIAFARELDPAELSGRVVVIPVANPPAVQAASYVSPLDGVNMSGPIYFGDDADPSGAISHRIGALIGPLLETADAFVDLHGNLEPCAPMVMTFREQARDQATLDACIALADAFGFTDVDMSSPVAHPSRLGPVESYPVPTALQRGIPALMVELTGCRTLAGADLGARGLTNVARRLGMLEGVPEVGGEHRLPGYHRYWGALSANSSGLMWVKRPAGVRLRRGEPILEITDLVGNVLEQIESPVDGFCWWYAGTSYGMSSHLANAGASVALIAHRLSDQVRKAEVAFE